MNRPPTAAPPITSRAATSDPLIDSQPTASELREAIRLYVRRLEVLRHMLRVSLKRECLGILPGTVAKKPKSRKVVRP